MPNIILINIIFILNYLSRAVKIPKFHEGLPVTPYRNQEKCPVCKEREKEFVAEKPCAFCHLPIKMVKDNGKRRKSNTKTHDDCRMKLSRERKRTGGYA